MVTGELDSAAPGSRRARRKRGTLGAPPSTRRGGCPDDLRSVAARGFVGLPVGAKDGAYQVLSSGTVGFTDSRIRDERRRAGIDTVLAVVRRQSPALSPASSSFPET